MTAPTPATVTKAEFADLCNVDRSRVSHWIRDGRISGAALVGTGRSARIDVAVAQRQLRGNLDPYQMGQGGNGAGTKLDVRPEPQGEPLSDDAAKLWDILSEVPNSAAWLVAQPGGSLQTCFDVFVNFRMDTMAEMRRRGFVVDESDFEDVAWSGLAEEFGIPFIAPAVMAADWQRRRDADG